MESVTVSITQDQQQKCANDDGMSDCCKTKYQIFKVKDNHVAGDVVSVPASYFCYLHLFNSSFQVIHYPSEKNDVARLSNAPPLNYNVPGYIFNCVFKV
ncbi:MAG: hypothetical protein ABIR50_01805 [Ginsengibacter sp.]